MAPSISNPARTSRAHLRTCRALGLNHRAMDEDEAPSRVTVWSVAELAAVQARVGGRLSVRPDDEDPLSLTVTLTVDLPEIGTVTVETGTAVGDARDVPLLAAMAALDGRLAEQRHQLDVDDVAYRHLAPGDRRSSASRRRRRAARKVAAA